MNIVRWTILILIGIPSQLLVYVVYPFIWLYWKITVYKKPNNVINPIHENVSDLGYKSREPYNVFLDNQDVHGAFTNLGIDTVQSMVLLLDGSCNPIRRLNEDMSKNQWKVSGDVLVSWLFNSVCSELDNELSVNIIKMADTYLKNLGVQSFDETNKGDVSNRCNNFGINYCPDSEFFKIGQPMAGPQFYTSSSLFALASKYSNFYKFVFWIHWILFGGWYWFFAPVLWQKNRSLIYVRDITIKALYVHKYVFGNRWWIRIPMKFIAYKTTNIKNDMWYAIMGVSPSNLPKSMDTFFMQTEDFTSRKTERMSVYLPKALEKLANQSAKIR